LKAFFIVEKGTPYNKGDILNIAKNITILGRTWENDRPDYSFDSLYISRRHAQIDFKEGKYFITNLPTSKHGIKVNNINIENGKSSSLKHLDKIYLANSEVVLVFCCGISPGETLDFKLKSSNKSLSLNEERHEAILNQQRLEISGKLFDLFAFLYKNRNCAVSEDEIRKEIWPERTCDDNGIPFATEEEVKTLVYRLRKELGNYSKMIRTIRGYGYIMDYS
jgi:DNA-binding winged helix-turn-helix (wHTH) protein